MTLIYEIFLDILKMYLRTKNEVCKSKLSKVSVETKQTHRQTRPNALPRRIHVW